MSVDTKSKLEVEVEPSLTNDRVTIHLRDSGRNLKIGSMEITLHDEGVEIQAWHADDSEVDTWMNINAEEAR